MLGSASKTKTVTGGNMPPISSKFSRPGLSRNLNKAELGAVIFGCKNDTKEECLSKQLFGLPAGHFSYVKNIEPGLPLFLFNYSGRKLHGIFEAASSGQMNMDPYAWTKDGSGKTSFPAQVQIRTRLCCQPLPEDQFAHIIANNYYHRSHFWFELDHAQTCRLMSLFSSRVLAVGPKIPPKAQQLFLPLPSPRTIEVEEANMPPVLELSSDHLIHSNGNSGELDYSLRQDGDYKSSESSLKRYNDGKDLKYQKLLKLPMELDSSHASHKREATSTNEKIMEDGRCKTEEVVKEEDVITSPISQLVNEVNELKAFKKEHTLKMNLMEQKLIEAEAEIQRLKKCCNMLKSSSDQYETLSILEESKSLNEQCMGSDVIFLVGGYDGDTWLSSANFYSLSRDSVRFLRPMSSVRAYASVAKLNNNFYIVGGGYGSQWYDTVESYSPDNDEWTSQPTLKEAKGSLATVTINDKIFAMGGADGVACFSDMQMLDPDIGRWIHTRSMMQKRFALGAVALNDVVYAVGGYDGDEYLRSAERFDPREHAWTKIGSMNSKRGCHSLVVFNEKIYALGGHDGSNIVSSVEVFDPRLDKWMLEGSLNHPRGYASAIVLNDAIYMIGGVADNESLVESVECYEEGKGWQVTNLKAIGKRCFASAIVV